MGSLSAKYESGTNGVGTIANNRGDIGGWSYGKYQIATNTGTMNSFLGWAKKNAPEVSKALAGKSPGSSRFNHAWRSLASKSGKAFEQAQHGFIKSSHYTPAVARIRNATGVNVNKMHPAVQDVVWSIAVQHGAGGASNIARSAGIKPNMSAEQMIRKLYAERMNVNKYFRSSSSGIRKSVYNRFKNELNDALKMLR